MNIIIIIIIASVQMAQNIKSLTASVVGNSSGANVVSLDIEILTVRQR